MGSVFVTLGELLWCCCTLLGHKTIVRASCFTSLGGSVNCVGSSSGGSGASGCVVCCQIQMPRILDGTGV